MLRAANFAAQDSQDPNPSWNESIALAFPKKFEGRSRATTEYCGILRMVPALFAWCRAMRCAGRGSGGWFPGKLNRSRSQVLQELWVHVLLWDYDSCNTQTRRLSGERKIRIPGAHLSEAEKRRAGGARGLLAVGDPGREAEEGPPLLSLPGPPGPPLGGPLLPGTGGGAWAEAAAGFDWPGLETLKL